MQDFRGEHGEFAVLNEFTKVEEGTLASFWDSLDQCHNGFDNCFFKVKATFFPKEVGHESHQNTMFCGVGETQSLKTLDYCNFVFIGNIREKCRDLLQQSINGVFTSSLEEGSNGQCRNGSVGIGNQGFQVFVALGHEAGVDVGNCCQDLHGSKAIGRSGTGQKDLKDGNGRINVLRFSQGKRRNRTCRFKDHHLGFVSKTGLEEGISRRTDRRSILVSSHKASLMGFILQELGSESNQADECQGGLEGVTRAELLHELGYSQTVIRFDLVEEFHGMKLDHFIGTGGGFLHFTDPALDNDGILRGLGVQVKRGDHGTGRDLSRGVNDSLLDISFNGPKHGRVNDASENSKSIGSVQVHIAGHVFCETGGDNDDIIRVTRFRHFLNEQIHHSTKGGIIAQKQLGDSKKDFGGFGSGKELTGVLQVQKLGNDGAAFTWVLTDGDGVMEDAGFLEDGGFFEVGVRRDEGCFVIFVLELFGHLLQFFDYGGGESFFLFLHDDAGVGKVILTAMMECQKSRRSRKR